MAEFLEVLERVTRALTKHGVMHVVVGGTAAIIRGRPRTTMDIDIVLENDMAKVPAAIEMDTCIAMDRRSRFGGFRSVVLFKWVLMSNVQVSYLLI
ncbi:hypothetical protein GF325_00580 [Candidatus Bathyarchaeota archaeon]|nr:hypothetical protein [Candidatus Bathyarchaeota archaeon]